MKLLAIFELSQEEVLVEQAAVSAVVTDAVVAQTAGHPVELIPEVRAESAPSWPRTEWMLEWVLPLGIPEHYEGTTLNTLAYQRHLVNMLLISKE